MYDLYFRNLVGLPSPSIYAKIQPEGILGFEELLQGV